MSMKYKPADRGWAVMSTGIGLLILLAVAVWSMGYYNDYVQQRGWQVTASQLSRFRTSVKAYVGRYYGTLLAAAGTTAPIIVTPDMLKNTGLIEPGFSDTTADGQKISAAVTRHATNTDQLQVLVITTGGASLPYTALRNISVDVDMGGYVWKNANMTGAMESWSVPLASFGLSTSAGHVGSLIPSDELGVAREESDRLYRFAVTGKPDLNRMHTSIDMGENDLNNTGTVNAVTGNFSGNVIAGDKVTAENDIRTKNGWLVTQGDKGWLNETHGGGFTMTDNDWVRAINNKSISTGGNIRADGRLSAGGVLQLDEINIEGTRCDRDGLVSRDGTGAILSCQSGVWKKSSGLSNRVVRQASDRDTAVVYCASDETLTGGSASCNSNSDLRVKYSGPTGNNGWSGACPGTTTTVFAICFKK